MQNETAEALRSSKSAMASWVTDAFFRARPEYETKWGSLGRLRCTEDTEYHFSYLVEAVRFEYPELFIDYIAWAKVVLYSLRMPAEDLEQNLHWMKAALHRLQEQEVYAAAVGIVDRAIQELPSLPNEVPSFLLPSAPLHELATEWLHLLLSRRTGEARNLLLDPLRKGKVQVHDLYQHVITPVMYEVGRLWQMRSITEAEEHFCTHTTQTLLAVMNSYFETPKTRQVALGFCVANEQHDLGIQLVMDCYSLHGWDSVCLGGNVPTRNMQSILRNWQPKVVAISATMTFHLADVIKAIAAVRQADVEKQPHILVGGRPFKICPDLWRLVGADSFAHSCSEVVIASSESV
jgi:methanogenic corrinoid protein MtbC1